MNFLARRFFTIFLFASLFVLAMIILPAGVAACDYQGCSVDFWKDNPEDWARTDFSQTDLVSSVFDIAGYPTMSNKTLIEALDFTGGSQLEDKARLLVRQAVAGGLNATYTPKMEYFWSFSQLKWWVDYYLQARNINQIVYFTGQLEHFNNDFTCPVPPTAVTLKYFKAVVEGTYSSLTKPLVTLSWGTMLEINNVGFNLYCGMTPIWDRDLVTKINQSLILAQYPGQIQGGDYSFPHAPYCRDYWLGDVSTTSHETITGPVTPVWPADPKPPRLRN